MTTLTRIVTDKLGITSTVPFAEGGTFTYWRRPGFAATAAYIRLARDIEFRDGRPAEGLQLRATVACLVSNLLVSIQGAPSQHLAELPVAMQRQVVQTLQKAMDEAITAWAPRLGITRNQVGEWVAL